LSATCDAQFALVVVSVAVTSTDGGDKVLAGFNALALDRLSVMIDHALTTEGTELLMTGN